MTSVCASSLVETNQPDVFFSFQDLLCLLKRYLEPLKEETFLTTEKVDELFGNITEIVQFQQQFLHSLEQAIELEPEFFTTEDIKLFKVNKMLTISLFNLSQNWMLIERCKILLKTGH